MTRTHRNIAFFAALTALPPFVHGLEAAAAPHGHAWGYCRNHGGCGTTTTTTPTVNHPVVTSPSQPSYAVPVPQKQKTPVALPLAIPPKLYEYKEPPMLPGYTAYPNYVGPRDPSSGFPVPVPVFSNKAPPLQAGYQAFPNWTGPRDPNTGFPVATHGGQRHPAENLTGRKIAAAEERAVADDDAVQEQGEVFEVVLPQTDALDFEVIGIALPRY